MNKNTANNNSFAGFEIPKTNFFKMPDIWTDITSEINNLAELKVVEYVLRHTWGFREYDPNKKKRITIDEFMHGRKRKDGTRLDKGTKLSEQSVRTGIIKAIEHEYLEEEIDDRDKARIRKFYSLKMQVGEPIEDEDDRDDLAPSQQKPQDIGGQEVIPQDVGVKDVDLGVLNLIPRTETDTSDKHLNSIIDKSMIASGEEEESAAKPESRTGPLSIKELMALRLKTMRETSLQAPRETKLPEPDQEPSEQNSTPLGPPQKLIASPKLKYVIKTFSTELGEPNNTSKNIGRTVNIIKRYLQKTPGTGFNQEAMIGFLESAKGVVKERINDISGSKMAYLFAVVEQLLGLNAG